MDPFGDACFSRGLQITELLGEIKFVFARCHDGRFKNLLLERSRFSYLLNLDKISKICFSFGGIYVGFSRKMICFSFPLLKLNLYQVA